MTSVIESFENWAHLRHHQTPATVPASTRENPMQLSQIAEDLKAGATGADNWIHTILGQHLPALIAEVERYQGNPIVQELEALGETMLPPGDIALITGIIRMAGKLAGQGAVPQQADAPQQQADAAQGSVWQPAAEASSDPRSR